MSSELYRALTIRSSRISIVGFGVLGMLFGALNIDAWGLLAGMGAFGLAVMIVAQHHQHRTVVLLYLARPQRVLVLVGQVVTSVVVALGFAAISGVTVVARGEASRYQDILTVVPIIAVFAAANAAVVRRPTWLFLGYAGWFVFVEGLVARFEAPLPFSAFLGGGTGDQRSLLIAAAWTALACTAAAVAVRRDLPSD
ncbi:hypothetical protein Q3W71_10190 [Micromonospora sp. C28SCA-DRY-2]|uniref:hypothetical protein n=1 Tax=Micromonospora sp. C28SCA-DRY-2 TaxID=3059522 RepID=UPI00267758B6|nr:hypothetical protein [Micromonospora sp. C28SCA-DRY-2]MDO3702045.1 hypothetical protein [Micromonospora sp. C28SCA-DRY-2]